MLDWLHWGGQLVLIGGAGPTYSIFRESFLGNYLPADPTGENALLGEAELKPLAEAYPPTVLPALPLEQDPTNPRAHSEPVPFVGGAYKRSVPIQPPKGRRIFVTGLRPHPGASTIPLGEGSPHLLAVEARVGRGRITMLTINPTDPSLVAWPGLDTLIRRVASCAGPKRPPRPRATTGMAPPGPATGRSRSELVSHRQPGCRRRGRCASDQGQPGRPAGTDAELADMRRRPSTPAREPRDIAGNGRGDAHLTASEWPNGVTRPRCRDSAATRSRKRRESPFPVRSSCSKSSWPTSSRWCR